MKIILIGFMASGKSTLGMALADKLNIPFFDTDKIIENQESKSVNEIFQLHGESRFRELENQSLQNIKNIENFVLAVGGGLPCYYNMMDELNEMGLTVFLDVDSLQIYERTKSDKSNRPLLKDLDEKNLLSFINEMYSIRKKIYCRAKHTITISTESASESLEKLISLVDFHQKAL